MKNCQACEKKLVAYLHGELNDRLNQSLESHLETCTACRAELEAQRTTLSLLGVALETAPAPERLVAQHVVHNPVNRWVIALKEYWYGPQLKAIFATTALACMFFLLSGMLVIFSVVKKEEVSFSPPRSVERPKMMLKKPKIQVAKSAKPTASNRVVAKVNRASMADIALPEVAGVSGSLGEVSKLELANELEEVVLFGSSMQIASTDARMADASTDDLWGFESAAAVRPNMKLKKLQVPVNASRSDLQPKLRKRIAEKSVRVEYGDNIVLPEIAGVKGGLGLETDSYSVGFSMPDEQRYGMKRDAEKEIDLNARITTLAELVDQLDEPIVGDRSLDEVKDKGATEVLTVSSYDILSYTRNEGVAMDSDGFGVRVRPTKPAVFNPYVLAAENAFSTFSIDVDTASYGLARQQLFAGALPDVEQVRTEEFINNFDYDYRPPTGKQTFAVHSEMAPSPFRAGLDVLKIGIKGRRIGRDDHRGAVLTLVIDTSGSMATPERLGLVKQSLTLLIDQLNPEDQVAIVQFGGEARLVRDHTPASDKTALLEAINALQSGGPTQFDKGLELGYQLATSGYRAGDSNRIIILSDGVANLGELEPEAILEQVKAQRKKGIYLSVLGFGAGIYDDDMLEQLANQGDGMYAYIDTLDQARHLLVDQLASTLHVIASDVKIQVEFNPNRVVRYRQIGYENRQLTQEQFRDDTVDAGEVGSGQSVTALYDVELIEGVAENEPIATVYVRYRRADNSMIEEISSRVTDAVRSSRFEEAELRFQLAVCIAEFAERLRRSPYAEGTEIHEILRRLEPVAQELDLDEQVQELLLLISITSGLER